MKRIASHHQHIEYSNSGSYSFSMLRKGKGKKKVFKKYLLILPYSDWDYFKYINNN